MLREFLITDDVADLDAAPKNQTVLVDTGTELVPYSWDGTTWAAADAIAKDAYKNASIEIQDDGVSALAPGEVTLINFTGTGVTATEAAAGEVDVDVPGGTVTLFSRYADQATTVTTQEDLWTNSIAAGRLGANGDAIQVEYAGDTAANANDKYFGIKFAGTEILFVGGYALNGGFWNISATIVRVSASVVRCVGRYVDSLGTSVAFYTEITGLTLADANDLELTVRTPTAAGDLTARMAHCTYTPVA